MTVLVHAVDHVQLPLPAGAADRARDFYEGVLGLRPLADGPAPERPGTLRYRLGPQRLDLAEGAHAGSAPQAHLALRVRDVAALARHLRARGVPVDGPSARGDGAPARRRPTWRCGCGTWPRWRAISARAACRSTGRARCGCRPTPRRACASTSKTRSATASR